MTDRPLPSPELLRKLLRYEPDTGKLYWLPREEKYFKSYHSFTTWNKRYAHKEAFTQKDSSGYHQGAVLGTLHLTHRLIWAMQTGEWPSSAVDHIDRNRVNNRWANLRLATSGQNSANVKSRANSSSKYLGIYWHKVAKKWVVFVCKNYERTRIGYFDCEEEAAKAYDAAALKTHGEFANLNFPRILKECPT
jgi:hypothetical protein